MTEGSIQRLLYVSEIALRAAGQLPSTMEDILLESHARNVSVGVTGFLWSDGAVFAQVLEGAPSAVEAIFSSIRRDSRHRAIDVRLDELADARRFARWSMCGMTLSDLDESLIDGHDINVDLYATPVEEVVAMLERFCEAYGKALDARHLRIVAATAGS